MFEKIKSFFKKNNRGVSLLYVIIFGFLVTTTIILSVSSYAAYENRSSNIIYNKDEAFHIAEAGINYYKWHLAHNSGDYTDGSEEAESYLHEFKDKNGSVIGYFSLEIDTPLAGSSVVTVRSTGYTIEEPDRKRTIQVRLGFPSLTENTFLANDSMNFSFTTEVSGVIHSNGGIRFDGTTDSWVKSAKATYKYENQTHNGVWGGGGPKSFWLFPVPAVDFFGVTSDLSDIRDSADNGGIHLYSSGQEGWRIVFKGNNFDLYKVKTIDCYNGEGTWRRRWGGWYWDGDVYCYDLGNTEYVDSYDIPENGAIFIEDNVWVEGTVDGRVSVGVGRFPVQEPYKNIIISGNLIYNEKASDDTIGLLAQGNILVPYEVPEDMEINGALLSQFSAIYRPYYDEDVKNSLTIFGSQISYESGGWKYVNGWGNVISGFEDTNHIYDGNLKFYPPPGFPVGVNYELLSWEEIL
ncbi:MAG: hypothetical protein WC414_03835 [Patescibacteria group bacterium]